MVNKILSIFPDARVSSGYIRIRCPYHKDGKEKRPSMSILLEDRGSMTAGTCHCFACGTVVTLEELFEKVGATYDKTTEIARQLQPRTISLSTTHSIYKPSVPFRFSEYLFSRGIGEKVQERFRVYEKGKMVHMPVFDRDGKYLFFISRSTEGKYYYVEEGSVKTLYGIEEIDMSKPIVVVEGQIDAMTFWELGMQSVATLGADNISALSAIKEATSIIILAFDNDPAGLKAREKAADMLGRFRCRYIDFPEGVDINEMYMELKNKDKLIELVKKNTKNFVHNITQ